MNDSKVQPFQIYCMLLVFLLGTSIIFGTPRLVPDTWIVDIITLLFAALLFLIYTRFIGAGNNRGYYALLERAWGRYLGKVLILGYVIYFIYIASRNVRDMIELVMTSLLRYTPEQLLVILFIILVAYASAANLAVLGRLSVLIAGLVVIFFLTLGILLIFSHSLEMERLLPMFTENIYQMTGTVLKNTLWFPYGELIVFLVFIPGLGSQRNFRTVGLTALVSAGCILTLSDILQTTALGMENIKFSSFPLLDAARMINIFNFITRMDALVALIIIFGVLLKCSVFLVAAVRGTVYIFNSSVDRLLLPLALLIGALALLVTHNSAEHLSEGLNVVIYWLHIPAQFAIPVLTLVLIRARHRKEHNDD
ncbi:Spore germination protein YndE [compost metagenome]